MKLKKIIRNSLPLITAAVVGIGGSAQAQFRDVSKEWGFAGGVKAAFADFDGDGFVDLFSGKLWRNVGGKKFVEAKDSGAPGGEVIWGDFDNDGHVDLFQFTGGGSLYRNTGKGKFEAVKFPKLPTVNSRGAVWLDINNDGRLDLFVGGYEIWQKKVHPDVVYLNEGGGKFKEHWRSAKGNYSARGVTAADFNEDGFVDVFVSNYRLQPNHLWRGDGKGKLENIAAAFGAAGKPKAVINYTGGIKYGISGHTIGSAFGDLDNDGHIDLFVGNFSHPPKIQDRPEFLRNLGPKGGFKFEDKSSGAGLAWQESFASPALGDYDNDGDLDLYFTTVYAVGSYNIKNFPVLYRNEGNWKFKNVTAPEKVGGLGATYQSAWADIDNDGDLDLCTAGKIFLNENRKGNWITLSLSGDGNKVNRSAVGAIARIKIGDKTMTRHVETGTGEGNQNDLRLHFGLGGHKEPVTVEITWPGAGKQLVKKLAPNRQHRIEFEGVGK